MPDAEPHRDTGRQGPAPMTTLVTGGNGWVPCHLVRRLAAAGDSVVSYDLMPPDDLLRDFLGDLADRVVFEAGDVTDLDRFREVAERRGVDRIVHAAAITPRRDREAREPARIIAVNLGGTVNALEVARSLPGLRRFVFVSSGAVWGDQPGATVLDEETPPRAVGLYGVCKDAGERITRRYADLFALDAVSVRPANAYGPMERATPGYVGATELREMLRLHAGGQPILVDSLDGPYLDWTPVAEIAEGVHRLLDHPGPLPHDTYSITGGRLYGIGDVLAAFARYLPGLTYRQVPPAEANYRVGGGPPGPVPSNARLRADIGWAPTTGIDDGMRDYLAWVAANGPQ